MGKSCTHQTDFDLFLALKYRKAVSAASAAPIMVRLKSTFRVTVASGMDTSMPRNFTVGDVV